MNGSRSGRRQMILVVAVGLLWCGVVARVGTLQLLRAEFSERANSQRTSARQIDANTGRILDRDGRTLAASVRQPSVFVDPSRIESPAEFAEKVAPVLQLDPELLSQELIDHKNLQFRWLRRRTTSEVVAELESLDLPPASWGTRDEWRRIYPQGEVAAHLLGLRGLDGRGRGGIEERFASEMTGEAGVRRLVTDSRRRPLTLLDEISIPPQHGLDIRLTIDARLSTIAGQHLDRVMEEHQPKWAAAVLMDVKTGELLAAESRPTYDPNDPTEVHLAGFHHAFNATFEPGSTVKPLVVAAALDDKLIEEDSIVDCGPGNAVAAGRPMRDAAPLGRQPLMQVLAKSSNIGSARVAERLGPDRLYRAYRAFGFGEPVPSDFDHNAAGSLRSVSDWSGYSLGSLSIGHELSVTPLHLATAYVTLAQGRRVVPRLLQRSDALVEHAPSFIRPGVAEWIFGTALKEAVEHGTAKSMQVAGAEVFGKTGTAQKFDPEEGRYRTDRATCVVVAGLPASQPEWILVVVVDDPTVGPPFSGGSIAGPVAQRILSDSLRVSSARGVKQLAGRDRDAGKYNE